jgi:hypothetical protein
MNRTCTWSKRDFPKEKTIKLASLRWRCSHYLQKTLNTSPNPTIEWTIERNRDVLLNACKDIGLAVNTGKINFMEVGRCRGKVEISHIVVVVTRMNCDNL